MHAIIWIFVSKFQSPSFHSLCVRTDKQLFFWRLLSIDVLYSLLYNFLVPTKLSYPSTHCVAGIISKHAKSRTKSAVVVSVDCGCGDWDWDCGRGQLSHNYAGCTEETAVTQLLNSSWSSAGGMGRERVRERTRKRKTDRASLWIFDCNWRWGRGWCWGRDWPAIKLITRNGLCHATTTLCCR